MPEPNFSTLFSRCILTGLFAGILATLLCFAFSITYTSISGFPLTAFINVSSIIFVCTLLLFVCGIFFYYFQKAFPRGEILFVIFFVLLTAYCLWKTQGAQRTDDAGINQQFRFMLSGVILIVGGSAFAGIPLLFHNKQFQDRVV